MCVNRQARRKLKGKDNLWRVKTAGKNAAVFLLVMMIFFACCGKTKHSEPPQ
jgi:hypothetical protein